MKRIKSFICQNGLLAYCKDENSIYLEGSLIELKGEGYFFYNNLLYVVNGGTTQKIEIPSLKISTYNIVILKDSLFNNTFLKGSEYKKEKNGFYSSKISIYQIEPPKLNYELLQRYTFNRHLRYIDSLYVEIELQVISAINLISGNYNWQSPLNRNGDIFRLLGVRNDELLVLWKRGYDTYGVIAFNIQNGQILWNIDNNPLLNGLTTEFTNNQHSLFSTKGEGGGSYFIELDLNLKQVSRYGDLPGFRQNNLQITWSWVKEDKVYFTALHQSRFANTVGVFDYQTLELLWWETLPLSANDFIGGGESLQVDENKLYVLDSGGTLHIFERES